MKNTKTIRIDPDVAAVLKTAAITADRVTLPAQPRLEPSLYRRVNKVLEAAGGKWNKKAQAHTFDVDPRETLTPGLKNGAVVNRKQTLQKFYTPPDLAARLVELADINDPGLNCLEASAGEGAIADAMRRLGHVEPIVIDIEARACEVLKRKGYEVVYNCDFLEFEGPPAGHTGYDPFERIVMNPPFTGDQDIRHVLKAWSMLAPGGRLVSLMSPGWTTSDRKALHREFRSLVEEHGRIEDRLEGAFEEAGTGIDVVIVVLDRPAEAR